MRRQVQLSRRYLLSTTLTAVMGVGGAAFFLAGMRRYLSSDLTRHGGLEATVASLLVLALVPQAVNGISTRLSVEAQTGTLEQQAMSHYGLATVTLAASAGALAPQLLFAVVICVAAVWTGLNVHLDVLSMAPILLTTLLGAVGVGLVLGGVTLMAKKTGPIVGLAQTALVAAVALPVGKAPVLGLVPVAWGATLIRRVMVQGESIAHMPVAFALLVVHSAVLLAAGIVVFNRCERSARRRGSLGHY